MHEHNNELLRTNRWHDAKCPRRSFSFTHPSRQSSRAFFLAVVALAMAFSVLSVQAASMLDMSLEELLDVRIHTATLSGSEMRKVPATVTTITSEEIRESGSRNLNELLEVYVPNMLYLRHNWESSH